MLQQYLSEQYLSSIDDQQYCSRHGGAPALTLHPLLQESGRPSSMEEEKAPVPVASPRPLFKVQCLCGCCRCRLRQQDDMHALWQDPVLELSRRNALLNVRTGVHRELIQPGITSYHQQHCQHYQHRIPVTYSLTQSLTRGYTEHGHDIACDETPAPFYLPEGMSIPQFVEKDKVLRPLPPTHGQPLSQIGEMRTASAVLKEAGV